MAKTQDAGDVTAVRIEELERTPQGIVKRWLAELALADQAQADWRKEVEKLWDKYEGEKASASEFDIFWANTEILGAAVYNSPPQADVRRRFRDADPIGKAVSKILERSLSYEIDEYDFDGTVSDCVLDLLICGRTAPWIKYEPAFMQVTPEGMQAAPPAGEYQEPEGPAEGPDASEGQEAPEGEQAPAPKPYEKLIDQGVSCEHVQWDDFRHGPGKRWAEVPWVGRRHEFTYDMATKKFGAQIAAALKYTQGKDTERCSEDKETRAVFKVCVVWEFWDKEQRRVLFIAPDFKQQPCLVVDDPLHLKQFFPCPRPAYAIQNTRSLTPIPLYRKYKAQAEALNRLTARIDKITAALKVRGAYDAHLKELGGILEADDTTMVPLESSAEIAAMGGLDKAIWIMPVEKLIVVLKGLYEAREQLKQTIYEIVGIADILRGASDPRETKGAQVIKSQWGSIRVQKLQREIQRMCRDLIRLKSEVIAEQFTPQHLQAITGVQLPDKQQKQQAQMAAQQGAQLPPEAQQILSAPTWDDVIAVLRSDELRGYKIDVETDSTVAETINRDMQGLSEVIQGVAQVLGGIQMGLPVEIAKEVCLAIVRRARLGSAVEDALEHFQAPSPQAPDAGQQLEATKQQILDLIKSEGEKQIKEKDAVAQHQAGLQQYDEQIQQTLGQVGQVAQGGAQATQGLAQTAQMNQQALAQLGQLMQQFVQVVSGMQQTLQQVAQTVGAPKKIKFTRGPDNRIASAETMQ